MSKINRNASLQVFTKSKVRILGTKPSKDLKKGLLTLAEEVQLNELGSVKEVLMMGKKKDLRGFFVPITRMSEEMMQKSEDTGMQGMLRISHFSTNRYPRRTVRESLRFSKFVTRTTGKVLKKGSEKGYRISCKQQVWSFCKQEHLFSPCSI